MCLSTSSHSLDFRKDAFRLPGQEERWGQPGEQCEARCCSRGGSEDADRLLLSWFIFSCRGEVYDNKAVMQPVGLGTCFKPVCHESKRISILCVTRVKCKLSFLDVRGQQTDLDLILFNETLCGFYSWNRGLCSKAVTLAVLN